MIGSGPSRTSPETMACVSLPNQASGSLAAKPSKLKPLGFARQVTRVAVKRDCALADSSKAAKRCASRSSWVLADPRKAKPTPAVATAMMTITTNSSSNVNPSGCFLDTRLFRASLDCFGRCSKLLPTANVGIFAFPARLSVCSKRQDVNFAFDPGVQVLVGPTPGVCWQFV